MAPHCKGHTVKARAFAVSTGLHAVRTEVTVEATDPAGNKIKRWTLQSSQGFVAFEMPLSAKPLLGEWKLTASAEGFATDVVASFEVDEYVLPR